MNIEVRQADYANPIDAAAVVALLDAYAKDPMGGGQALSDFARTHLIGALAQRPGAFSVLAWATHPEEAGAKPIPVGLVNCLEGFSTFACKPLVNVHDVAVDHHYRRRGIAAQMLQLVEAIAVQRGACKLTLEVLSGNRGAADLYEKLGFESYRLQPEMGDARFMHKKL